MFPPQTRRQFSDPLRRMDRNPLQNIHQPGAWIDPVQLAGEQQALNRRNPLGSILGPGKQPVLSPAGDWPYPALKMVGINGNVGVRQAQLQLLAPGPGIGQRLQERILRQAHRTLELPAVPFPERRHRRNAPLAPHRQLFRTAQPLPADVPLNPEQLPDQLQNLFGRLGLAVPALLKGAGYATSRLRAQPPRPWRRHNCRRPDSRRSTEHR